MAGLLWALYALVRTKAKTKTILLVLTNHGAFGTAGKPTGFYLSEAAHPWKVFREAGYEVLVATPEGGFAPVDPASLDLDDPVNAAFWKIYGAQEEGRDGVAGTEPLAKVASADDAAIFFAGGHGTMWDFASSQPVIEATSLIYENGGSVGAVCHGPAALLHVKLPSGEALVKGKKVAAFTDGEEASVEMTEIVPFLLEDELRKSGADVKVAGNFEENAIRDGRLVTGQNPQSAKKTAQLLVETLS